MDGLVHLELVQPDAFSNDELQVLDRPAFDTCTTLVLFDAHNGKNQIGGGTSNQSVPSPLVEQVHTMLSYAEDRNAKVSIIKTILKKQQDHALLPDLPRDLIQSKGAIRGMKRNLILQSELCPGHQWMKLMLKHVKTRSCKWKRTWAKLFQMKKLLARNFV